MHTFPLYCKCQEVELHPKTHTHRHTHKQAYTWTSQDMKYRKYLCMLPFMGHSVLSVCCDLWLAQTQTVYFGFKVWIQPKIPVIRSNVVTTRCVCPRIIRLLLVSAKEELGKVRTHICTHTDTETCTHAHGHTHTSLVCILVKLCIKFALPCFHDDSRKFKCRWVADQLSSCSGIITRLVISSFRKCVDGVCVLECPPVKLDKGSNTLMTPFPNLNSNLMTLHNVFHKINHT